MYIYEPHVAAIPGAAGGGGYLQTKREQTANKQATGAALLHYRLPGKFKLTGRQPRQTC
jgi:hypothetical protein